jgi:pilus assembly protein Flp/PilA
LPRGAEYEKFRYSFFRNESGVTAIEYGLIAALISVVCIAAMTFAGQQLLAVYNNMATRSQALFKTYRSGEASRLRLTARLPTLLWRSVVRRFFKATEGNMMRTNSGQLRGLARRKPARLSFRIAEPP